MTLLNMQDKTTSGKPLPCEHCDSGDQVVSRCTDCSVFMCEFCVTAHKRITTTKRHQILSLADVQKLGSKALVQPAFCVKHTGETLKLYCETCQETICRDCTIVDHREHKYNFVADVAERERKVVQDTLNKTKSKERAVVKGLNAVQTMKERVQSKVSDVNKEIDAFFNKQVKTLEDYRENLKHEVMTQSQVKVKQLEKQSEALSSFLAQLKSGMDFTSQAIADGDDVKLLSVKKQLTQRLAQLNASKIECKPCKGDYLKLQVHQTVCDLKNMATLRYLPIDPQKCTVSMVGGEEGVIYESVVGQTVDFVLTIKDKKVGRENNVGSLVKVQVSYEEHQTEGLPVCDNGNGSCKFSYRPKAGGPVTLSVMVGGQNVAGSPFNWQVIDSSLLDETIPSGVEHEMLRWKLQLTSFNAKKRSQLEIGVRALWNLGHQATASWGGGAVYFETAESKWSWSYNTLTQSPFRSDDQHPSITSVQDNDLFTVYLNLETQKLIIYNDRSRQSEIFTGVQDNGAPMHHIASCIVIYPARNLFCDIEDDLFRYQADYIDDQAFLSLVFQ